jgi:hypothetical protein
MSDEIREVTVSTPKLAKAVEARLAGHSYAEVAQIAGYNSANAARQAVYSLKDRIPELFDKVGLTEQYLARKLFDLTNASTTHFFQKDGEVVDEREVADNTTQLKANLEAMKMRGAYPKDESTSVNTTNIQFVNHVPRPQRDDGKL